MSNLLESDFCRQRRLRINRVLNLKEPLVPENVVGATSLGCNIPVSHHATGGVGTIFSRVSKQTGEQQSALLTTANEFSLANPVPSPYLSGSPEVTLNANLTLPFPAAAPVIDESVVVSGFPVAIPSASFGMGSNGGIRRTVILPPGDLEFLEPETYPLHRQRVYYKTPSVGLVHEPLTLVYTNPPTIGLVYQWVNLSHGGSLYLFTHNVINQVWFYRVRVNVRGTPPVLVGHAARGVTLPISSSPTDFNHSDTNGPAQDRKYSYIDLGAYTAPDYNETQTRAYAAGGFRPEVTVYRQSAGPSGTITFNGTAASFGGANIPTPQYAQFVGAADNNFYSLGESEPTPGFRTQTFGPVDQVAQFALDPALTQIAIGVTPVNVPPDVIPFAELTIMFTLPKTTGQRQWFEILVTTTLSKTGPDNP